MFLKRNQSSIFERVVIAWDKIHRRDGAQLGKKDAIALIPCIKWVQEWIKKLLLLYDIMEPLQEQPTLILSEYVPTEYYKQVVVENI